MTPSKTPGRLQALPLNFQTPYVQQYSLDIQQQITPTLMLDVGYFGDHGTHLLGILEINQPAPGAWVGKVQPSNSGSACLYPGSTTQQAFLNSTCDQRVEPDQAVSRILRDRCHAVDLQLELQLAAGEGDQAILGPDLHRRELHMVDATSPTPRRTTPELSRTSTTSTAIMAVPPLTVPTF